MYKALKPLICGTNKVLICFVPQKKRKEKIKVTKKQADNLHEFRIYKLFCDVNNFLVVKFN